MLNRVGALVLMTGLAAAAFALPAAAQTNCQTIQFTTTRVTNPITVTPLDAIAFPATLNPQTSTVVRQGVICPPVSTLPTPVVVVPPTFVGAPGLIGAPYYGYPYAPYYPYAAPYYPYAVPSTIEIANGGPAAPSGRSTYQVTSYPFLAGTVPADTVRDLAARSAAYDRMTVTVSGTAAEVHETSDAAGRPLTVFVLQGQGAAVNVVAWGHLGLAAGQQVRVSGPFYVSSPFTGPGGRPWHNVIEAQTVDQ
jgi:hypothetical protein